MRSVVLAFDGQHGTSARCELAIIGGGIGGCMLAAAMARQGVDVLVLEAGTHPKFSIGESMILETSEIMRSLALVFDVPELEYFSAEHFMPVIGGSHGVKRHFSYMPHRDGMGARPEDVIQAIIPERPYGHELHIYRQDSDYFYVTTAIKYGARVLQNTPVLDVAIKPDGVTIETRSGQSIKADYVVDAGGFRSIIAEKKNLRRRDLQTHTRGLFTHMRGVPSIHASGASRAGLGLPYSLSEGTLHHVFDGGWLWVIPFDNHAASTNDLCSVGLLLDPRIHGPSPNITPEEEFRAFIGRFPDIARHLSGGAAVRDWVRAERIQYTSSEIVGDRFCLLGHAAGFIDPLFSKGLYTTLASVLTFGQHYLAARKDGDFSRARFLPVEAQTQNYVQSNDRLVANAIKSFAHGPLWRLYAVIWILGAYLELVRLTTWRQSMLKRCRTRDEHLSFTPPPLKLVGGGYGAFEALARTVDEKIEALDMRDADAVDAAVAEIRALLMAQKWIPYGHRLIARGARHLPRRKFSWRLFMSEGGILGRPDYRQHFFGDTNLMALGLFMMRERVRYSRAAITRAHRKRRRASL